MPGTVWVCTRCGYTTTDALRAEGHEYISGHTVEPRPTDQGR